MKRMVVLLLLLALTAKVIAQGQPTDGYYEANKIPWGGYFLPTTKDQLVSGEEYRLYPGPLPKLFHVLGWDPLHPGIDTELLVHVIRDGPNWFGICNGWAVASIKFPEPQGLVAKGVKFFPGDVKAILTSIHKANQTNFIGSQDTELGGLSAESFEQILSSRLGQGEAVIFDEDYTEEVWNYPVAAYERKSNTDGMWTYVTTTVYYAAIIFMTESDKTGLPIFNPADYYYRYKTDTRQEYEWLGESVLNHPGRAWLGLKPYHTGAWLLLSNHFFNLENYQYLVDQSLAPDHKVDIYEPNQSMAAAFPLKSEMVLASLLDGDDDFYLLDLSEGEPLNLTLEVYDGDPMNLTILDGNGTALLQQSSISNFDFSQFLTSSPARATYYIKLTAVEEADAESYYKLLFPRQVSSFTVVPNVASSFDQYDLLAVNTRASANALGGGALDTSLELATYGSYHASALGGGESFRASNRTVWVETAFHDGEIEKKYYRDHAMALYTVPHLTFKNGWDTRLDLHALDPGTPVWLAVHGSNGGLIERVGISFGAGNRFQGSLAEALSPQSRQGGAWFRLETDPANHLRGVVSFVNGAGAAIKIDIEGRPRIGELIVFNLKSTRDGSTGIALVNTSELENEVLYSLEDKNGTVRGEGVMVLPPGGKWLATVAALSDVNVNDEMTLYLHAQFKVEGLVIQHQRSPNLFYGHRILSKELDQLDESLIALPEDRNLSSFVFANYNTQNIHVLFEGFAEDGSLQGRFNIEIGNALRFQEMRLVPLTQILQNGVGIKDLDAITHFRLTSKQPVFMFELIGEAGTVTPMSVHLPLLYDNP